TPGRAGRGPCPRPGRRRCRAAAGPAARGRRGPAGRARRRAGGRPTGDREARRTMALPRSFYDRLTLDVARDLLGKVLVHDRGGVRTSGVIVELEAYIGESDPACHAAPGPTARNAPLYGPPGYWYVYLNYGIHALVNVVTEADGSPAAILIRALDPLDGIASMQRRRARAMKGRRRRTDANPIPSHELCRGPGNLTMAMG